MCDIPDTGGMEVCVGCYRKNDDVEKKKKIKIKEGDKKMRYTMNIFEMCLYGEGRESIVGARHAMPRQSTLSQSNYIPATKNSNSNNNKIK